VGFFRGGLGEAADYLNMMIPPMKVAQSAAPQEVAKQRRWDTLAAVTAVAPEPERAPKRTSGAKRTPAAKKHTADRNRVAHAIADCYREIGRRRRRREARVLFVRTNSGTPRKEGG
jgi:hypothetical protein